MEHPPLLFIYRSIRDSWDRERTTLLENKLWFSTPDHFNDPFEAKPHIQWKRDAAPLRSELARLAQKFMPTASRKIRRAEVAARARKYRDPHHRAEYRRLMTEALLARFAATSIACFAESDTDVRMWSYYAAGHSGYCMGFGFYEPWEFQVEEPTMRTHVRIFPMQVRYEKEYPAIDPEIDLNDRAEAIRFSEKALLTKAKQWESEREWRCFRPSVPSGYQLIPRTALQKVIFGARMAQAKREELLLLIRELNRPISVFQASVARGQYDLILNPIKP
jgi:Protein of unknown function (DUF2971)